MILQLLKSSKNRTDRMNWTAVVLYFVAIWVAWALYAIVHGLDELNRKATEVRDALKALEKSVDEISTNTSHIRFR